MGDRFAWSRWARAHHPQPGSRRLLVEAAGGFEQLLAASHERSRALIRILRGGATLAEDDRARGRLTDGTDLFEAYVRSGDEVLRRTRSDDTAGTGGGSAE
ncbi:hypothetical protein [Micromonospora sp. NPDC051296]|uniref:hypothetical protein n=1 Tax=Micromonospora sp. NPDC051296 TaxID=3155046 RepID=UPI0034404609